MFIIIVYLLESDKLFDYFFVPTAFLSIITPLFLHSSSVSLPYFIVAFPMHECLEKHSCMSS